VSQQRDLKRGTIALWVGPSVYDFATALSFRRPTQSLPGPAKTFSLKQSRNAAILRKAHAIVAHAREQDRLRRCAKSAAYRAIAMAREAYEKINSSSTSDVDQKRWRERRELVEAELMRIVKSGPA